MYTVYTTSFSCRGVLSLVYKHSCSGRDSWTYWKGFYHLSSYLQEHVLGESHSAKTDLYPWRCVPVACKSKINSYFRPWALSKTKEYIVWRLILLCIHSVMIIFLALLAEIARQPPYKTRQNEWNICSYLYSPTSPIFLSLWALHTVMPDHRVHTTHRVATVAF